MHSVLLSSGGLDSAVTAALSPSTVHLTVDYGQNQARQERRAAELLAKHYDVEHVFLSLPAAADVMGSSLTGMDGEMSGPDTVVPNRNAMLLSLGVALAMSRNLDWVLIGVNKDDREVYADCRPAFIRAYDDVAQVASAGGVRVMAPLMELTKRTIGQLAHEFHTPVELTWSCYTGELTPCGACNGCRTREEALGVRNR